MKSTLKLLILSAALAAPAMVSAGEPVIEIVEEPVYFADVYGGAGFGIDGDFTSGFDGLAYSIYCGCDPAELNSLEIDDVFDNFWTVGLRFGRAFSPVLNGYVGVSRTTGDSDGTLLGEISGIEQQARFGDYEDIGVVGGLEWVLNPDGRLHPVIGLEAGVRFVDDIGVVFIDEFGSTTVDSSFYDDSTVFTAGLRLGLLYDLTRNFSIGVESGIWFQTDLDGADSGLAPNNLQSLNDEGGSFFAVPVLISGRLYF